jgi:hypothetical protein
MNDRAVVDSELAEFLTTEIAEITEKKTLIFSAYSVDSVVRNLCYL